METSLDCVLKEEGGEYIDMSDLYNLESLDKKNEFPLSELGSPDSSHSDASNYEKSTENPNSKSRYKHVPHREKPVQVVVKRNARERRRVQTVNGAFTSLRKHIPYENRHKRLSKVKTLRIAIDYIKHLQEMLGENDSVLEGLLSSNLAAETSQLSTDTTHVQSTSTDSMQNLQMLPPMHFMAGTDIGSAFQMNSLAPSFLTGSGSFMDLMTSPLGMTSEWGNPTRDMQKLLQLGD